MDDARENVKEFIPCYLTEENEAGLKNLADASTLTGTSDLKLPPERGRPDQSVPKWCRVTGAVYSSTGSFWNGLRLYPSIPGRCIQLKKYLCGRGSILNGSPSFNFSQI